jgi:hypothetical protein
LWVDFSKNGGTTYLSRLLNNREINTKPIPKMKYLIEDYNTSTCPFTYIREDLEQLQENITFRKSDLIVDLALRKKLAVAELKRIFNENGSDTNINIDESGIHLTHTGHMIALTESELEYRFQNAFDSIVSGVLGE